MMGSLHLSHILSSIQYQGPHSEWHSIVQWKHKRLKQKMKQTQKYNIIYVSKEVRAYKCIAKQKQVVPLRSARHCCKTLRYF